MKQRICVFGNYSGRNAGDNALLEGLMDDISSVHPSVEFLVPTINPRFVAHAYRQFTVRPVSLLPWNGSMKILGWPTLRAALCADLILVTDAILFDRHFWNPFHNYLHTLSYLLPLAASRGISVVAYNSHLGPLTHQAGRRAIKRLLDSCSMVILRDEDSLRLMHELGHRTSDVILGADCALNVQPCSIDRVHAIAEQEHILRSGRPLLTITLSAYLGTVPGKRAADRNQFIEAAARMLDTLVERLDVELVMVVSQYMDVSMNHDVLNSMKHRQRAGLISNRNYNHNELAGILEQSEMHVSMRTHPMIFASSLGVPVVSIDANPKNASFLRSIGQGNRRISIHEDILGDVAADKLMDHWRERNTIRSELARVMPRERAKAREVAAHLTDLLAPQRPTTAQATLSVNSRL